MSSRGRLSNDGHVVGCNHLDGRQSASAQLLPGAAPSCENSAKSHAGVAAQVMMQDEMDPALAQQRQIVLVEVMSDEQAAVAAEALEGGQHGAVAAADRIGGIDVGVCRKRSCCKEHRFRRPCRSLR